MSHLNESVGSKSIEKHNAQTEVRKSTTVAINTKANTSIEEVNFQTEKENLTLDLEKLTGEQKKMLYDALSGENIAVNDEVLGRVKSIERNETRLIITFKDYSKWEFIGNFRDGYKMAYVMNEDPSREYGEPHGFMFEALIRDIRRVHGEIGQVTGILNDQDTCMIKDDKSAWKLTYKENEKGEVVLAHISHETIDEYNRLSDLLSKYDRQTGELDMSKVTAENLATLDKYMNNRYINPTQVKSVARHGRAIYVTTNDDLTYKILGDDLRGYNTYEWIKNEDGKSTVWVDHLVNTAEEQTGEKVGIIRKFEVDNGKVVIEDNDHVWVTDADKNVKLYTTEEYHKYDELSNQFN